MEYTPVGDLIGNAANGFKDALGGLKYADIAARAVMGNALNQGIGNLTGSQQGFSWSSVAISGIAAPMAAFASNQLGLAKMDAQGNLRPANLSTGNDLGRAAVSAGANALTQLAIRGGRINWQQVATDTILNFTQSRLQTLVEQQRNTMGNTSPVNNTGGNTPREDSAKSLYDRNLELASQGDVQSAMLVNSQSDGGLRASMLSQQPVDAANVDTMPRLFTALTKDGGSTGGTLAQQTARRGGWAIDYVSNGNDVGVYQPKIVDSVAAKARAGNAINTEAKISNNELAIEYAQAKLVQQQTLASKTMSGRGTPVNNWDGKSIGNPQSGYRDLNASDIATIIDASADATGKAYGAS